MSRGEALNKAEAIQQLKSRISRLELEKSQLQGNVIDADHALRTASKDRECMSVYVKNLLVAFDKVRSTSAFFSFSRTAKIARYYASLA